MHNNIVFGISPKRCDLLEEQQVVIGFPPFHPFHLKDYCGLFMETHMMS
jgi:hypothetical protein